MFTAVITGGIGVGKSFVAHLFEARGVPIFNADSEAKKFYDFPEHLEELKRAFGGRFFRSNNINFAELRAAAFSDSAVLKQLNALIHPFVRQQFQQWAAAQTADLVMMETALHFESALGIDFDAVIVVDAPLTLRKERIAQRNKTWTEAEISARINAQMTQEEKCQLADYLIVNDGTADLETQINTILKSIKQH